MYCLFMKQCNFKIKHWFKILLVFNTANDFTVLPIVNHDWGAKRGNEPTWSLLPVGGGNSTVTHSSTDQRSYGFNAMSHIVGKPLSWDCGWLRAEWPRGRSSRPDRVKNFLFSTSSRPVLGSTQPPIQGAPGALSPGVKRPGREADHSPPASAQVKKVDLYIHSPIRLHGVVLNFLSTGTTLLFILPLHQQVVENVHPNNRAATPLIYCASKHCEIQLSNLSFMLEDRIVNRGIHLFSSYFVKYSPYRKLLQTVYMLYIWMKSIFYGVCNLASSFTAAHTSHSARSGH
jgi:hypothetical protein